MQQVDTPAVIHTIRCNLIGLNWISGASDALLVRSVRRDVLNGRDSTFPNLHHSNARV